jgi:hypothetical protein
MKVGDLLRWEKRQLPDFPKDYDIGLVIKINDKRAHIFWINGDIIQSSLLWLEQRIASGQLEVVSESR